MKTATASSHVDDLIQRGRSRGHLSLSDLRAALEQAGLGPQGTRSILLDLSEAGVQLIDDETGPFTSRLDPIETAITADLSTGLAVVAIRRSGAIASWNLATGRSIANWPAISGITSISELRIGGQAALLANAPDKDWICLDPLAGTSFVDARPYVRGNLLEHPALAARDPSDLVSTRSIVAGRVVDITGPDDKSWTLIDHLTRHPIGHLADEPSRWTWQCKQTLTIGGRPFLATGSREGVLALWDLTARKLSEEVRLDGPVERVIPAGRDGLVLIVDGILLALKRAAATGARSST